jgi:hypothetical protein
MNPVIICISLFQAKQLTVAYLGEKPVASGIIQNICLCDGNSANFICKQQKQDATLQENSHHPYKLSTDSCIYITVLNPMFIFCLYTLSYNYMFQQYTAIIRNL